MNFLLSTYFYPLPKAIILSKYLNIAFDNPRSKEEIDYIAEYLKNSHENSPDPVFPPESKEEIITLDWVLQKFKENFSEYDKHVKNYFNRCKSDNVYYRLAKMWIIARYDDKGEFQRLKAIRNEMISKDQIGIILLEDDNPIEIAKKNLINFFSLVSLLSHSEVDEYYGRQMLSDNEISDMERHVPNRDIWRHHFMMFMIHSSSKNWMKKADRLDWTLYPKVKNDLMNVTKAIDHAFNNGESDNLLHVGSVLNIIGSRTRDDKVRILLLTSCIEFLLTHNPDFNRFNVEESINKQFQLKTTMLVYLNNKNNDIEKTKERLRQIYHIRSCIAHGNFQEIDIILNKLSKKSGEQVYLSEFVSDLYAFLRVVLEEKLKDTKFVKFLKES